MLRPIAIKGQVENEGIGICFFSPIDVTGGFLFWSVVSLSDVGLLKKVGDSNGRSVSQLVGKESTVGNCKPRKKNRQACS